MKGRTNNPFGRPRKGTDRQTVMVRIEKRHFEMLCNYTERRRCLEVGGFLAAFPYCDEPETEYGRMSERRAALGEIIERACSLSAMYPVNVEVKAPEGNTLQEVQCAADWMAEQGARLTAHAPVPFEFAFSMNAIILRVMAEKKTQSILAVLIEVKSEVREMMLRGIQESTQDIGEGGPKPA